MAMMRPHYVSMFLSLCLSDRHLPVVPVRGPDRAGAAPAHLAQGVLPPPAAGQGCQTFYSLVGEHACQTP